MGIVIDSEWSEPNSNSTEDIEAAERRNQFEVEFIVKIFFLIYNFICRFFGSCLQTRPLILK